MMSLLLLQSRLQEIEARIEYVFKNKDLLVLAFTHRSYYNEHRKEVTDHNERLEFLGDSVLGLIISDYLYLLLPSYPEGQLSHLRSQLVEAGSCAQFLWRLHLSDYVLLGKGERMNEGRGRETILADLFEALIGAIYLDGGLEAARRFFFAHFEGHVKEAVEKPIRNWKAELQDYSQKKFQTTPSYRVVKETGSDHCKVFHVEALIEDKVVGEGIGSSKKEAEQAAAHVAMQLLET